MFVLKIQCMLEHYHSHGPSAFMKVCVRLCMCRVQFPCGREQHLPQRLSPALLCRTHRLWLLVRHGSLQSRHQLDGLQKASTRKQTNMNKHMYEHVHTNRHACKQIYICTCHRTGGVPACHSHLSVSRRCRGGVCDGEFLKKYVNVK